MECSKSISSWKYNVFVSFRGEDTRHNFSDHLFAAFQRKALLAFRDDRNLNHGDHISTELMQAIEASQVLIVVLSKNYANSSWCLQELAKIVDCMNREVLAGQPQLVLPVFYDVSPSEVRKQSGDFYGKAFAEHEERFKHDLGMVNRWREALVQVANLSGSDVHNKPQNKEIENIVDRVLNICYKLPSLDGLVGIRSRVEQLEKFLDLDSTDDIRVVGIIGMGGIGKTTLARALYDRNLHRYGATCFIDDTSKVYRDCGPIGVQKQLICQTKIEEIQETWNLSKASYLIKTRLRSVKAFIILDNVDKVEQLESLSMDRECLCAGSRIIIISRDRHILNNYGVDEIYHAQLLNEDDARQLFCKIAFKHDYIMGRDDISREYKVLTELTLIYAQGLPLAIKVLGSFLNGKTITEWQSALDRLRDIPNKDIMDVLQISFDGLEPKEKEIFLDIACFYNYKDKNEAKKILEYCGFHPEIGIRVLIDKSLITVDYMGLIRMHDMLKELGKKIVQQDAPNEPWKWSRIWFYEDFCSIMTKNTEMNNLEAINLRWIPRDITLRAGALSKMNRLRSLILSGGNFSGILDYLSSNLRYLEWKNYPFTYFPSNCELTKLVVLHLHRSNIKQLWEGTKLLVNLKIMDLRHSKSLVKTPDFSGTPYLEVLILEGCTKLAHIHPSIGILIKLVCLDLTNCTSLRCLPDSIGDVISLEFVHLEGCSRLFRRKRAKKASHGTRDIAVQCQSKSSMFKLKLPFQRFNSRSQNDIGVPLMSSLSRLGCLKELDLGYCNLLNIPDAMVSLGCLERLLLRGNNFVTLPCVIKDLPSLIYLNLEHCKQLRSLYEFPLHVNLPERRGLICRDQDAGLSIFGCPKLAEMENWSTIALSWMIQFLKFHEENSPPVTIVVPGTQVPSWFNSQCVGDSITIEPFPNFSDSSWIGLAFCAAFVAHYDQSSSSDARRSSVVYAFGNLSNFLHFVAEIKGIDGVAAGLNHLCLVYVNRQQVTDFVGAVGTLDDICFRLSTFNSFGGGVHFEVKHCGMRVVYKQDLEEFNGDKKLFAKSISSPVHHCMVYLTASAVSQA